MDIEVTWNSELGRVELGADEDEWRLLTAEYNEADNLEGLNLNDETYDGFSDETFLGEEFDDLATEQSTDADTEVTK